MTAGSQVEELILVGGIVGVVDVLFVWFVVGVFDAVLMLPWWEAGSFVAGVWNDINREKCHNQMWLSDQDRISPYSINTNQADK